MKINIQMSTPELTLKCVQILHRHGHRNYLEDYANIQNLNIKCRISGIARQCDSIICFGLNFAQNFNKISLFDALFKISIK